MEDVEGGRLDNTLGAGLAGRGDHVSRALAIHPIEDPRVGEPLLEEPHAVERAVDALGRGAQRLGIGDVAARELDALGQELPCLGGVAHQRDDLVATLGEPARDRVADLSGGAGDQGPHRQATLSWCAR